MMKKVLWIALLLPGLAWAQVGKVITPQIHLKSIKAEKTVERQGDELYLAITVFPSHQQARHYQIPRRPAHWLSTHLNKLKDIQLWQDKLKDGESVTLVFALVEHDAPPWNTDDLIGEVKLHMRNVKGELESSWTIPNRTQTPVLVSTHKTQQEQFELIGEGSRYLLKFSLAVKPNKKG